jgi:hypothetical protein
VVGYSALFDGFVAKYLGDGVPWIFRLSAGCLIINNRRRLVIPSCLSQSAICCIAAPRIIFP